ncbi:hypothetical protein ACFE04_010264 [Oxalis oulophora]
MDSDIDESLRKRQRVNQNLGDSPRKLDLLQMRQFSAIGGEMVKNARASDDDLSLEASRARLSNLLKREGDLVERMARDSDKMVFERLQKEFETARATQAQEIYLDGEEWNDTLLATIRERVHMETDRKTMSAETNSLTDSKVEEKPTYKAGNKVIFCLEGPRIGIQYETSFVGEPCDLFHIVLESKSFLEKMTVREHSIPSFLPLREAENDLLSTNAMRFIDYIGELVQAYVDRREQVRLIRELYANQIEELYHSLPFNMIEFVLDRHDCRVTFGLRYGDLTSLLPSRVRVWAFPMSQIKKNSPATNKKENDLGAYSTPVRLSYAEDLLRSMSLPQDLRSKYYSKQVPAETPIEKCSLGGRVMDILLGNSLLTVEFLEFSEQSFFNLKSIQNGNFSWLFYRIHQTLTGSIGDSLW